MDHATIFATSDQFKAKCDQDWAVFTLSEIEGILATSINPDMLKALAVGMARDYNVFCGVEIFIPLSERTRTVYMLISRTREDYEKGREHLAARFKKAPEFDLDAWFDRARGYLQDHEAGILDALQLSDSDTLESALYLNVHGILATAIKLSSTTIANNCIIIAKDQSLMDATIANIQRTLADHADANVTLLRPN